MVDTGESDDCGGNGEIEKIKIYGCFRLCKGIRKQNESNMDQNARTFRKKIF